MAYGSVKVDTIIFDNAGVDQNVTVSGLYRATTSGITVSGTISGATVIGSTLVSGSTVTGTVIQGTTIQGISGTFTSLTGTTTTGTTANFASGVFTTSVSGTIITGDTGQFTSGTFVSLTGTTITGTTINAVTVSSTTGTFTSLIGTTITGTTINGVTVAATTGSFTSLTGTTITGTTASFTTGNFTTLSGTTVNLVSGIVDPNGKFLIGTSTARSNLGPIDLSAALQVEGTDYTTSSLSLLANGATNASNPSPVLHFARSRGASVGSNTIVQSGDSLGVIDFEGSDGTRFPIAARIQAVVDGTPGVGDMPGRLVFGTTSAGASSTTERMRITSSGVTSTNNLTVPSINNGALAGIRNRIINGDMRISQRGTSFPAAANAYNLDRWQWSKLGAMVCTVSQDSDVPNNTFQNSYKVDVTTIDTSISSTEYAVILQRIEGYNIRDLIGTTFTLSFWVKSPKTGTHCVAFRNDSQDRSFVTTYSITTINTWEYKTITVTNGLITAGGWDWTNGTGLEVAFILASGSTYQTTANSWNTGNFLSTSAQVNVMDNVANNFFLTGVQLEPGTVATPFERRNYGQELELCSRYFQLLTYYGGAYTGTNACFVGTEDINKLRGIPAIASSINGFQFFNGSVWTTVSTSTGATLSIYTAPPPFGTWAIQVDGLTGNLALSTTTSAAILGTLSAEL